MNAKKLGSERDFEDKRQKEWLWRVFRVYESAKKDDPSKFILLI